MVILHPTETSGENPCPYIGGAVCRYEYFFATDLSAEELERFLCRGWRKFGFYYFRPACQCRECVPLRIPAADFSPSKSQRRILRKNSDIEFSISPLRNPAEVFDIYREHSLARFGKNEDFGTFIDNFYNQSCPAAQSEFRCGGKLVGAGFLDISSQGVSSVYFVYRKEMLDRSFGIFSMMQEIGFARQEGLPFYYPGYWIKENPHMLYKASLRPHERFDRDTQMWSPGGL